MSTNFLGIAVNPRNAKPVLVAGDSEGYGYVFPMDDPDYYIEGEGALEDDPTAKVTGFPRVHILGVETRGAGYGTALYSGMCLIAHAGSIGNFDTVLTSSGDGISSSQKDRKPPATNWWRRAISLKVAERISISGREFELFTYQSAASHNLIGAHFNVDMDDDFGYRKEVALGKELVPDGETTELPFPPPRLRFEVNSSRYIVNMYDNLWRVLSDKEHMIKEAQLSVLLSLNMRYMTEGMYNLISVLAQHQGASEDDLFALRLRWEYELEPAQAAGQLRLHFTPNAQESRELKQIVTDTEKRRKKLGWDKLASLP